MGDGLSGRAVHVGEDGVVTGAARGDEGGDVVENEGEIGVAGEAGIERGAVDGGDAVAAFQKLGGHAARACSELEPMGVRWEGGAEHGEVMEGFRNFRAGAADGVVRVLGNEFRAAGVEAVGGLGAGDPGVETFLADQTEEGFLAGVLVIGGFRGAVGEVENLQRPPAQIRGEGFVVGLLRAGIKPTDEDGLRVTALELVIQRLRGLFDEAVHFLRVARP